MDLTQERSRRAAAAVAGVAVLGLVVSLLVVAAIRGLLPGTADCTVTIGKQTVELSTDEAEAAAAMSARSVRLRRSFPATTAAVADALDRPARESRLVAAALTGRARRALACTHGGADDEESDRLGRSGLTARAAKVRRDIDRAFGRQRVGGFARGGVSSGHMPGSAHYDGRAVDVFLRPINRRNKARGWAIAQYLVAQAERLEVNTVIFDGQIWTERRAGQGWRDYEPVTRARSREVRAILLHRDHVHVDVAD
jgi:hypothetical protein